MGYVLEDVCMFIRTEEIIVIYYSFMHLIEKVLITGSNLIVSTRIGSVVGDEFNFVYVDTENHSTVWPGLFTCSIVLHYFHCRRCS